MFPVNSIMNIRVFITLLLTAFTSALAAPPATKSPTIDVERLVRAYGHLTNAEQMATGGVVLSKDALLTAGRAMSADALKKECGAIADRIVATLSSSPAGRRPETFAYVKNAMLRLTLDREEPHGGHVEWASKSRDKVSSAIRNDVKKIKDALNTL